MVTSARRPGRSGSKETYGGFPLGGACVIATAERLGTDLVLSLDRRHMLAVRTLDGGSLRVLPD